MARPTPDLAMTCLEVVCTFQRMQQDFIDAGAIPRTVALLRDPVARVAAAVVLRAFASHADVVLAMCSIIDNPELAETHETLVLAADILHTAGQLGSFPSE